MARIELRWCTNELPFAVPQFRRRDERYVAAALQAYRNFDGQGSAFGDTSIEAKNSNPAQTSVYASLDASNPNRIALVLINKQSSAITAGVTLAHAAHFKSAQVYTLTAGGGPQLNKAPDISAVAANAFRYAMPAQSVSVLIPSR